MNDVTDPVANQSVSLLSASRNEEEALCAVKKISEENSEAQGESTPLQYYFKLFWDFTGRYKAASQSETCKDDDEDFLSLSQFSGCVAAQDAQWMLIENWLLC